MCVCVCAHKDVCVRARAISVAFHLQNCVAENVRMQSVDRNRDSLCKLTSNNTVSSHPISTGRTVKLF